MGNDDFYPYCPCNFEILKKQIFFWRIIMLNRKIVYSSLFFVSLNIFGMKNRNKNFQCSSVATCVPSNALDLVKHCLSGSEFKVLSLPMLKAWVDMRSKENRTLINTIQSILGGLENNLNQNVSPQNAFSNQARMSSSPLVRSMDSVKLNFFNFLLQFSYEFKQIIAAYRNNTIPPFGKLRERAIARLAASQTMKLEGFKASSKNIQAEHINFLKQQAKTLKDYIKQNDCTLKEHQYKKALRAKKKEFRLIDLCLEQTKYILASTSLSAIEGRIKLFKNIHESNTEQSHHEINQKAASKNCQNQTKTKCDEKEIKQAEIDHFARSTAKEQAAIIESLEQQKEKDKAHYQKRKKVFESMAKKCRSATLHQKSFFSKGFKDAKKKYAQAFQKVADLKKKIELFKAIVSEAKIKQKPKELSPQKSNQQVNKKTKETNFDKKVSAKTDDKTLDMPIDDVNDFEMDFSALQNTQAKELSSARILEDARKMEFISEMMASQEMDIFKDRDPGFSEITKQSRKYLNEIFKDSPLVDRDERILEGITKLHGIVAGINDEAIDYYVGQDNLDHQKALYKLMEASKSVCEQETILDRYKDRAYDLSDITSETREKLGLGEYEVFSDISDLDEEMLKLTFSHIKETEVIQEKYADRKWASRAIEENLECLKQVVESIKSGDTEKAFKLLENNWAIREKVGFRCLFHDSVDFVEGFGQGLYSGAKQAINIPQRIVDLYNTAKGLGRILGRIGEIDMLVKQGNIKDAQEKWRALENDLSTKFSAMWEGIKQKWEHATPGEIGFSLGELTGDGMTTQQMCKWTQKLTKVLTPKVEEAKRKAKKAITEFVQKGKDKTKDLLNPAPSKTVTTPEGVTVKVDTPTSQSTITKKTSKGKSSDGKTQKGDSSKKKTETKVQKERIVNKMNKTEFFKSPDGKIYNHYKGEIYVLKDGAITPCKKARFATWDYTHNDLEVWSKNGKHLGSWDPLTKKMYKPALPRKLEGL